LHNINQAMSKFTNVQEAVNIKLLITITIVILKQFQVKLVKQTKGTFTKKKMWISIPIMSLILMI